MNILVVTAMFPPIRTGTSFYSKNLSESLTRLGHNVTLVTLKNSEEPEDNYPFEVIRLKAIHLNVKNYFKHLRIASLFLSNYSALVKIIRERDTDIILLVNHYLDIAFPVVYASKKTKIPFVVSVGTQMQSLNPFRNRILNMLDRLVPGKLVFPYCRNIISWDREIHRYIENVQSNKIVKKSVIIPFGVNGDPAVFAGYKHPYSVVSQILGVGAIIDQRDFLFNIRVFKELLTFFPGLKLKIIGHVYNTAPVKLTTELGLEDKVEFLGEQPHNVVLDELQNSTIHWMMLSGEYVGLGTSTIEAMQMGLPVISNVPENLLGKSLLKDMENYVYTDSKDIENTVNKIKLVLDSESLRQKIGLNGKKFVEENMNWNIVAEKYTELFNTITGSFNNT